MVVVVDGLNAVPAKIPILELFQQLALKLCAPSLFSHYAYNPSQLLDLLIQITDQQNSHHLLQKNAYLTTSAKDYVGFDVETTKMIADSLLFNLSSHKINLIYF